MESLSLEVVTRNGKPVAEGETDKVRGLRDHLHPGRPPVVVVANYLANRYSKSWDATSNKRYSLSQESKKIVDGLKSPATITYFMLVPALPSAKTSSETNTAPCPPPKYQVSEVRLDPKRADARRRPAFAPSPHATVQYRRPTPQPPPDITEEGITCALQFREQSRGTLRTVCFLTGSGEHAV